MVANAVFLPRRKLNIHTCLNKMERPRHTREYLDDVYLCNLCDSIVHRSTSERHTKFACLVVYAGHNASVCDDGSIADEITLEYRTDIHVAWEASDDTEQEPTTIFPWLYRGCILVGDVKYIYKQIKLKYDAQEELIRKVGIIWRKFDRMAYKRTIIKALSSMLSAELSHLVVDYL
jgi:hypothetical protein